MKAVVKPRIHLDDRTPLETVIPLSTPFILNVDPASACNFQCTFCPTGDRSLIKDTGRFQGRMKLEVFQKIIDDLAAFPQPLKVLRLYKDGEPFLNKNLAQMVDYARRSGRAAYIDTTTNGSLLEPARVLPVIEAGLDRINISIDGMNREQYLRFTKFDIDFEQMVANIRHLYEHRGDCEVFIKIPSELITTAQRQQFLDIFGEIADRIYIENFAPCWPEFDVEARTGIQISRGIYDQEVGETNTCPYIFYSMSVNADGQVSSCFLDWGRKLLIGDVREQALVDIWNSPAMNDLRIQHLEGRRKEHPVCGKCGQLTHCLPDNIDVHAPMLLERMQRFLGRS